jgi:IMP cyclohydrolase
MIDLFADLRSNSYPGRGIILGRSACGKYAAAVYFIMGRSANSRNRVFVKEGDGLRIQAYDPSKMTDPSLIIYFPVRCTGGMTIVTNGDQTDTIFEAYANGRDFDYALRKREFEPDKPNYTPRISGIIMPNGDYRLSILKSFEGDPSCCIRSFFEYSNPPAGRGHFIHTYARDGDILPSFEGEPKPVKIEGGLRDFALKLWDSLDSDNKVSLFARFIEIETGKYESVIFNKYGGPVK